jgi:hypothetical protein
MSRAIHFALVTATLAAGCDANIDSFRADAEAATADGGAAVEDAAAPAAAGSGGSVSAPAAGSGGSAGPSHNHEAEPAAAKPSEQPEEEAAPAPPILEGMGGGTSTTFTVALNPDNEFPPCAAAAKWATGTGSATISDDGQSISVELSHYNLSGAPTIGHIHAGKAGFAGPPVLDFGSELSSPIRKVFTAADYRPKTGAPADFPAFVESMRNGASYFNIHTEACGSGEIRGQIEDTPPPEAAPNKVLFFAAELSQGNELTACDAAGAAARAVGAVAIAADKSSLSVEVRHAGLSNEPIMGHIHFGDETVDGPVVLDLGAQLGSPIRVQLKAADYKAPASGPADFVAFLSELEAGNAYLNLHTEACPKGEVRGQLSFTAHRAKLTPEAETKPCADAGLLAIGLGTLFIDGDETQIELELAHAGLSSEVVMAHVHVGTPGIDGPVVLDIGKPTTWPVRKVFSAKDYKAAKGAPADFAGFVQALKAGEAYFNLHTEQCASGEVRGQIE